MKVSFRPRAELELVAFAHASGEVRLVAGKPLTVDVDKDPRLAAALDEHADVERAPGKTAAKKTAAASKTAQPADADAGQEG